MKNFQEENRMAKGYWICFYRSISNPDAVAEYAKLAGPAIQGGGGRFLGRGLPTKTYEAGKSMRTVVIEFDSVQQATTTFESPAYQAACRLIEGAAERDIRIIEGLS
jgi:uncharacterized protein (DUF1330 family)